MKTQTLRIVAAIGLPLVLVASIGGVDWLSALSHGQSPIRDTGGSILKLILTDGKEKYTFGDDIRFQQKMENESEGQAAFEGFDFYYQNRPKLLRNGKAVPYKSKTDYLVRSKETDPGGLFISVRLVRIEAHSDRNLEELDLSDWYDALQPGSYQLRNKYRISFDGPWTKQSAEMQFRIEPKN